MRGDRFSSIWPGFVNHVFFLFSCRLCSVLYCVFSWPSFILPVFSALIPKMVLKRDLFTTEVSCLSQNTLIGHKWGKPNTLFLYINIWMLLSGLGCWIFLLFCCFWAASILGLSLIINYSLWHFRFRMSIGVSILIPVFLPFSKSNN